MNNYVSRNSIVHRINPVIKVIAFLLVVILTFLKTDFLIQIFLLLIVFLCFVFSKLPYKIIKRVLITYVIMFLLLFLVNWITQKNPIAIPPDVLNNAKVLNGNFKVPKEYTLVGSIYGGKIVTDNSNQNFAFIFEYSKNSVVNNDTAKAIVEKWLVDNNLKDTFNNFGALRIANIGDRYFYSYFIHPYGISEFAWVSAFYISNKLLIVILASTILTSVSTTIELTYAFENLLKPLKLIRFPANELAMIISIALRFIPSLISESFRIMNAQASRGIDFKNGRFIDKATSLVSLIVPLFTVAFIKADDLANAMTARSYNPRYARSQFRTFSLHFNDILFFLFFIILITFGYYLTSRNFIFYPFNIANALVVAGI